ncbi:hypothetical protein FM036_26850 [Nostoc sp. HG1]|nr:hypothetical protein [Nostoc sp. HG1]MCL6749922.1 hypothetical protein [Nostoc sp. CCCryo 231-06]
MNQINANSSNHPVYPTVTLLSEVYIVKKFADHDILPILGLLQHGLMNSEMKFEAAKIIKKVIIPNITEDIVYEVNEGNYNFAIDSEDINLLLMQILKAHYSFQIERARSKKKPLVLIKELTNNLENVEEILQAIM